MRDTRLRVLYIVRVQYTRGVPDVPGLTDGREELGDVA